MGRRAGLLAAALVALGGACAPAVPLAPADLRRLQEGSEIPVVYRRSPAPWVDCPGDEGEHVWVFGGVARTSPPTGGAEEGRPASAIETVAASGPGPGVLLAGNVWQDFQEQWTASLREAPPDDPARATAAEFLALSLGAPGPLPFRPSPEPMERADPPALAARLGSGPALVFEATRWVLVGCWTTYKIWFDVRATLLDVGSGKVLWRDTCGGVYPPPSSPEASPSELQAEGKALYASRIDGRAGQCARWLHARVAGRGEGGD